MTDRLVVSLSPHEKGDLDVNKIMWTVAIALVPAFLASVYYYGLHALRVIGFALVFCIGIEYLIKNIQLFRLD